MTITKDAIENLAPDQASLTAARKLLKPAKWPELAGDNNDEFIWGECQGSGSTPYRAVFTNTDFGYKCSCPSRKFPCKHVLALMWLRVDMADQFQSGETPDWVNDWASRRRGSANAAAAKKKKKGQTPSLGAAAVEVEEIVDPKAAERAAKQKERNRQAREQSILAGLDDLDLWIADQLERGLARFQDRADEECRIASKRLVDAKASGLATRLSFLPMKLMRIPDSKRNDFAIRELGSLRLASRAYRKRAELPEPLQADINQLAGWNISRDELLESESALRVKGSWVVLATRSEVQPDRLRRIETWLLPAPGTEGVDSALLLDFMPVATGNSASPYVVGDCFEAELVFYPSATPQRALIASKGANMDRNALSPAFHASLDDAFETFESRLAANPWLGTWPVAAKDVRVRHDGDRFWLADAQANGDAALALPLPDVEDDLVLPLLSAGPLSAAGLWDGAHFDLTYAQTSLGPWTEQA